MNGREAALELWREATALLLAGEPEEAIALFTQSLQVFPTAEAYTFRGWAYSIEGRLDDAIEECHKAIRTDPSFGNPYNDIGCYLVQKGAPEQALAWFERAKKAPRYEPRHFPHLNLGRIYAERGDVTEAVTEFQAALAANPGDPIATRFLEELKYRVN
jgi:Tfp pilus assembly protein PilF